MSNTIKNFLVGVGLDASNFNDGEKDVTDGLNRIKTVGGFAGAALIGAFGGAAAAAVSAGSRIDQFNLATERMSASAEFAYDFGNALRMLGGNAGEALDAITAAEKALDEFNIKGSFSAFDDPTLAGVDTNALRKAQDGEEFLRLLSDMVPNLDKDQQRLVQDSFGFSNATMRSLRQGQQEFDALIKEADSLAGSVGGATDASREFNRELESTQLLLEKVSNTLAEKMLPTFSDWIGSVNNFAEKALEPNDPDATTGFMNMWDKSIFGSEGDDLREQHSKAFGLDWAGNTWDKTKSSVGGYIQSVEDDFHAREALRENNYYTTESSNETLREYVHSSAEQPEVSPMPVFSFSDESGANNQYNTTPKIENKLDVKMEIDGQALNSKIISVTKDREQATMDEMQTTTAR